jgi:lipopolysaccharide exporter
MADGGHGVGTRTLRGMFWAYGSYVGGRVVVLLSVAILARLLTPSQFGLVAFALTVTALLDTVGDLGVSQALIVVKDPDETAQKANTAWTLSVCLGAGLSALTGALSPLAAAFFDEPALTALLSALGLNFLLRGAGVTHFALAQKQIDFRTRTAAELADVLTRGVVGVVLALAGAGAWSLVIGYLAGSAAMTTTLWTLVPWRPRIGIVRSHVRSLLRFGGAITALDVLSAIIANVDYIFVGRVLGKAPLGLYTLGFRLPELLVLNLAVVAGLVLFPAFAGISRGGLGDAFLTSMRYTLIVGVPLGVGLAVLAEPVTLAVFGDQWRGSVDVMRVLTVFAFCVTVGMPAGTAYKSLGRVDVLLKLAVPRAVLAVVTIAIFADHGIVAVAACQAGVAALFAVIGITLAARLLGTGVRRIVTAALPAVCAGVPLAAVLLLVERALDDPWLTLAVATPLGAVTYVGALWLVAPDALRRLWRTAFPSGLSGRGAGARAAPPPTP